MWKIIWMIGLVGGIGLFISLALIIGFRGYAEVRELLTDLKK